MISVDPGFDPANILTFNVAPNSPSTPGAQYRVLPEAIERLKQIPGVKRRAGSYGFLSGGPGAGTGFSVVGRPAPAEGRSLLPKLRIIHPTSSARWRFP